MRAVAWSRESFVRYRITGMLALCVYAALAQDTISNASLSGRVTDPSGGVVAGAVVTARQEATNRQAGMVTDRDGRFRLPLLKPGAYAVTVKREGFAEASRAIVLTVGSAFDVEIALSVASERGVVTVNGEGMLIETARTQVAGTVGQVEIASLPLNGRSFLDLALLVPGVSPTNTGSNQLFAETSAVPGQGISVGSQRNFSNSFIVDGLSANDDAAGLSGVFYGLDVVQELQVVTSGGQAELGRALGGYINVVTKSGTNSLHGDLYGYFRNQRFNAANPLSNAKLPLTQAQYGASAGGPIHQDRTFYFANLEARALNQSGLITIGAANVAAINARLAQVGYPGQQISTGLYPNPVHSTNFLGKVDHRIRAGDQFAVRYSVYDVHSHNSRGAGALSAPSASAGLDDTDQTVAVTNVATVTSHLVNETRGQFTYNNLHASPADAIGPAVSISGVASFGTLSGSPTARENKMYEVTDNLSYQRGAHAFRVGGDFLYNSDTIGFPRSNRGAYTFSSLANFLSGTYNSSGYTQTFGNTAVAQTNPNVGFYAQDEWKAAPRLTLNFGLRYDLEFLKSIATDTNNVSPRAGVAWAPLKSRKLVVRGGFGLFYDRVPLRGLANALLSGGNTTVIGPNSQESVSLSPAQAGAPVFPNIITVLPAGALVNFSTMIRQMQNAYAEQGNLEIEQQVGADMTLSVGYEHLRGMHLIVSVNQNVPACAAAGTNNGCRPNPAFANNSQYQSLADSHYDGLHISFVKRPAKWANVRVSYTFSKALDNVGEFFFSAPIDNGNIWRDYGRSDDDQRHRVVVDGALHTHGFQWTGFLQYYSALPFNIVTGATTLQGTAARPLVNGDYISRNAGAGSDFFSVGSRISRTIALNEHWKLEALAEAFNLLNHRNDLTRNGTFGTGTYPVSPNATFGQITAVNDPRSMQLALRLRF